ncbi:hypothetical protein ACHWQZ_G011932 [Mnemiopsis leidyi]
MNNKRIVNITSGSPKDPRIASTPVSCSKSDSTHTHFLDTSTISNISCFEKDGTFDGDKTITNVMVKMTENQLPDKRDVRMNKENVGPFVKREYHAMSKGKSSCTTKKRKVTDNESDNDSDDSIVFMENPKKSIQMNQSTSDDFLRLGSSEREVAVGIFWDIENVRMPKGLNPAILITKLREKFVDESSKFCEKHFYVVCDAREESYVIMKQLFEFHVRIIHVPRLKANSSDNVIRDLMHEFVGYNKYCRVVLISGDSDFSHDIHNFRRNKKCHCILIHNQMAKDSLKKSANAAYLYTDLIKDEIQEHQAKSINTGPIRNLEMEGEERFIKGLINKMLRVQISDGRVLVGSLLCTDRDQNLIMGGAAEYWHDETAGEARMLGLVMIPGRHITSVQVDTSDGDIKKLLSDHDKVKMGLLTILKKMKEKEKEMRLLMLGLDNAGKTTILKKFNGEDISTISPTLGFNIKTLEHGGFKLNIWDVGGQKSLRSYWKNYFETTDGLIWVVDSADKRRLEACSKELSNLLLEERLAGATLLVFANKQDLPGALEPKEIREVLELDNIKTHHWIILGCSAVTGENLLKGMDWLIEDIASRIFTVD